MKLSSRSFPRAVWCVLAVAALTAPLFSWSFIKWKVPFYAVSVALMLLSAVAAFTLLFLSRALPFKKSLLRGAICGAVYIGVIEGVTLLINNVWLGGSKPWAAAITVTVLNFLLYLVLTLLTVGKKGFAFGRLKKALAIVLCVLLLIAGLLPAVPDLLEIYYSNTNRRVATPVGFATIKEDPYPLAGNADFYVSPNGSDKNPGSFDKPFATVERAQEAVRALDKTNKKGVTVALMAGEYRVSGIKFTAEDGGTKACPVTWCAYGDGEVILNGGVTLDPAGFTEVKDEAMLARFSAEAKAHIRCYDLTAAGVTAEQYGKIYTIGSYNTASRYDGDYTGPIYAELFVNDTRCTLARYPNEGWLKTGEVVSMGKGKESNGSTTADPEYENRRNPESDVYKVDQALADRVNGWKSLDDVWMFGFWKYTWADASTPIGAFNYKERTLSPKFVSLYGAIKDAPYYFFNIPEELDAPGEWYLDRENGKLYLYADGDLANAAVDLSLTTDTLIRGEGVNYLTLRGLTLKGTRGDAVYLTGDNNTVERCLIKNVAGTALKLEGYENLASRNEITRTGMAGIWISGGDPDTLTPGNSRAENNLIHDWSEIYQTYQPAVSLYGMGNVCAHNEIYNSPHEAITYSGPNQLIEYNVIHDVCLISDDAGAIYAGRNWSSYGCVVQYNAIYNLGTPGEHSPQGIYMDDGLSGQTIRGNLLVNVPCMGVQLGGGRDLIVQNNIIVNTNHAGVDYDQRAIDGVLRNGWFGHCDEMWDDLNRHPWQSEAWQKAFPQYQGLHFDESKADDPMFAPNAANSKITGNLLVNIRGTLGNIAENAEQFSDISGNAAYRLSAMKKLFNDPDNGDYTLRADAPVFKQIPGFQALPLDQMGRQLGR